MRHLKYRLASALGSIIGYTKTIREPHGIRVLMFHGVGDDVTAKHQLYNHAPDHFRSQILAVSEWLSEHNQRFVAFDDTPKGGVCLTFDDGYSSIVRTVAPFLLGLGIPFHIFVPINLCRVNQGLHLTQSQIRDLASEPLVGIGSHGYSHVPLNQLSNDELRQELTRSRYELEELTGRTISTISYPFGSFSPEVCRAVHDTGYIRAATSQPGLLKPTTNLLQIPRTDIWAMDSNRTVINKIRGGWDLFL